MCLKQVCGYIIFRSDVYFYIIVRKLLDSVEKYGKAVKLSLPLTKHYVIKISGGVDVWVRVFLTSALAGSEYQIDAPAALLPKTEILRNPSDSRLDVPQSRPEQRGEMIILDTTGTRSPTPRSWKQ
jgi:hypothetical protein